MGLLECGYHYCIERDGAIECIRPPEVMGSHTPGCNHNSVGVCLAGGWEGKDDFTPAQITNLGFLVMSLQGMFGKDVALVGHSEVQRLRNRPPCPGLDMGKLRETLCLPNP